MEKYFAAPIKEVPKHLRNQLSDAYAHFLEVKPEDPEGRDPVSLLELYLQWLDRKPYYKSSRVPVFIQKDEAVENLIPTYYYTFEIRLFGYLFASVPRLNKNITHRLSAVRVLELICPYYFDLCLLEEGVDYEEGDLKILPRKEPEYPLPENPNQQSNQNNQINQLNLQNQNIQQNQQNQQNQRSNQQNQNNNIISDLGGNKFDLKKRILEVEDAIFASSDSLNSYTPVQAFDFIIKNHLKTTMKFKFRIPNVKDDTAEILSQPFFCDFQDTYGENSRKTLCVMVAAVPQFEEMNVSGGFGLGKNQAKISAIVSFFSEWFPFLLGEKHNQEESAGRKRVKEDSALLGLNLQRETKQALTEESWKNLRVADDRISEELETLRPFPEFINPKNLFGLFCQKKYDIKINDVLEFEHEYVDHSFHRITLNFHEMKITKEAKVKKVAEEMVVQKVFSFLYPECESYYKLIKMIDGKKRNEIPDPVRTIGVKNNYEKFKEKLIQCYEWNKHTMVDKEDDEDKEWEIFKEGNAFDFIKKYYEEN